MKPRLRLHSFLIAIASILLVAGFYFIGAFENFENRAIDFRFRLRGPQPADPSIVIAAIDEYSLEAIGNWPWPRQVHARLTDLCRRAGAKAIFFDVLFLEPDRYNPSNDREFARALKRNGKSIMAFDFRMDEQRVASSDEKGNVQERIEASVALEETLPMLAESSARIGFVNTFPDLDGYSRWATLSFDFEGETYYPANVQTVSLISGREPAEIVAEQPTVGSAQWDGFPVREALINWRVADHEGYKLRRDDKNSLWFSVATLLDPGTSDEWKAGWLKDKVILVGSTALGLYDHYPTPFSASLPGLYYHANVIDNLLTGQFLTPVRGPLTYAMILILGLMAAFFVMRLPLWTGALASFGTAAVFWLAAYWLMTRRLICIDVVSPVISIAAGYLSVFFYRFIIEQKEKAGIKKAFGVYVNPHVVDQIAKNPDALKLGGELREMTVMFSDVAGFTSISEKLSPQELVQLLNLYLTAMTDTIMKNDGTVDKYEGDAIMAFWGAPLPQPEHAKLACMTVLDNRERLKELNAELEKKGMNKLSARCGLNTGPMNVGNMGSSQKFNYTVMGDSVNLASRLEGANKQYGTQLMISESTYAGAKDSVEVRELDLLRVKGKKIPIKVYELVCRKGQLTDAQKRGFELYGEALELYRGRKFKEALKKFQGVLELLPEDPPSETYIQRAKDYIDTPPGKDWDGVYVMTTK